MDGSEFQELWQYIHQLESRINDLETAKEELGDQIETVASDVRYLNRPKEEF